MGLPQMLAHGAVGPPKVFLNLALTRPEVSGLYITSGLGLQQCALVSRVFASTAVCHELFSTGSLIIDWSIALEDMR